MNDKQIAVILLFSIWILIILIFGILALNYHFKNKDYLEYKNKTNEEFIELKKNFSLSEIKIDFEMNADEKCFFKKNGSIFLKKNKLNKIEKKLAFTKDFKSEIEDDWDDLSFKKALHTEKSHYFGLKFKLFKPNYSGDVYITNKRILIINEKNNAYQIPLSNIINIEFIILSNDRKMSKAFKILTISNDKKIFLDCDSIEPYFIFKKIKEYKGDKL